MIYIGDGTKNMIFVYDQEFENYDLDAFKFVQESNFDSVAWNDWRTGWVKTRIVFVLQNGKVFQDGMKIIRTNICP